MDHCKEHFITDAQVIKLLRKRTFFFTFDCEESDLIKAIISNNVWMALSNRTLQFGSSLNSLLCFCTRVVQDNCKSSQALIFCMICQMQALIHFSHIQHQMAGFIHINEQDQLRNPEKYCSRLKEKMRQGHQEHSAFHHASLTAAMQLSLNSQSRALQLTNFTEQ